MRRSLPMASKAPTSFVVYRGQSAIDGHEIVAILTGADGRSENSKVGPSAQVWIMRADLEPHTAVKLGADRSVCGDCPLRPSLFQARKAEGRILAGEQPCYVNLRSPVTVWRAHARKAVDLAGAMLAVKASGAVVRLGAYGDPAALPEAVVEAIASAASATLGYTHQWREAHASWAARFAMASVDSPAEQLEASALGWRTFRVAFGPDLAGGDLGLYAGEIECVNTSRGVTCADCGLCDGLAYGQGDTRKSIVIAAH